MPRTGELAFKVVDFHAVFFRTSRMRLPCDRAADHRSYGGAQSISKAIRYPVTAIHRLKLTMDRCDCR